MTPTTRARPGAPALRDRRSVEASLARLPQHRAGAQLLAQRDGAAVFAGDAKAKAGRIRARDRMFFFSQLSVMISAGVPVAVALEGIARQADRLKMRQVLKVVLKDVEGGQQLSAAMGKHPRVFPPSSVHLVRAGETSGDMSGMLTRIQTLLEREYEMKKKLSAAVTYPAVMVGLSVVTVIALFTFVLPNFRKLYAGKEDLLPRPTRFLLAAGDFVSSNVIVLAACAVAAVVGMVLYLRTPRGKSQRDSFVLALPLAGGIVRRFSLARSVRSLGALLQSGVPVLTALELARDLASNQRLAEAWEYVRAHVEEGGRVHEAMAGQAWFPGTLVQMTAMGEAGGILDAVLVKIGQFYDQEAEAAVQEGTAMIEPLMVVVVGVVVGFIAMSIMLPIFNMSKIVH